VTTLSEESLCWERPEFTSKEQDAINWIAVGLKDDIRKLVETTDREKLFNHSKAACKKLHDLLMGKEGVFLQDSEWEKFLRKLGLTALPVSRMFGAKTKDVRFINKRRLHLAPPIEIHAVRPAFRAGREKRQKEQVIVTFSQSVTVDISDDPKEPVPMSFRGGCSLILSFGDKNEVEYLIVKDVRSHRRLLKQIDYLNGDGEDAAPTSSSLYADSKRELKMNFAHIHSHT